MAEHHPPQHQPPRHPAEANKGITLPGRGGGPTTSQLLSVAALLPVGGTLLALSGLTLVVTVLGLALAAPVFVIFSPVLVPAAVVIGLAVAGFLASGAFGLTAVTALSWIVNYLRAAAAKVPEQMEQWKKRMAETAAQAGQRTKDVGERIQTKAHEARTTEVAALPVGDSEDETDGQRPRLSAITLLALSGLTLAVTVIGLALATPVFVLFSPVLVPAAIMIGLVVAGFLASGAFAATALSWIVNYLRGAAAKVLEQMEQWGADWADDQGRRGEDPDQGP